MFLEQPLAFPGSNSKLVPNKLLDEKLPSHAKGDQVEKEKILFKLLSA